MKLESHNQNKTTKTNPDLEDERKKCQFDVNELAAWWYGSKQNLKEKRIFEKLILENSIFKDEVPQHFLSNKEVYEAAVKKSTGLIKLFRDVQKTTKHEFIKKMTIADFFTKNFQKFSPMAMNFVMFIPTVNSLGTEEQKKLWVQKAMDMKLIAAFAQTELGHGTFVRGLETRADYDSKTEEFVLNSPTLTSYKWWPGSLAHTANYAIVLAQLHSKGKNHGVYQFVVKIRDDETYQPLPGIKVGNIGSKMGMNTIDNGYLAFENFRVPRHSMLMGNAKLEKDGTFIKPKASVLVYGPMTIVRVGIVRSTTQLLIEAVTIATRYSAVRRQSPIKPDEPEPKIIDHVTQQLKVFPQIARALIFKINANYVTDLHQRITSELHQGDYIRLPELHALSCCLKAVCSFEVSKSIEILRLACGGHGYMSSSNLPQLYASATPACTYEGENTVLLLQTGRYLLKAWKGAQAGKKLPPSVDYLNEIANGKALMRKFDVIIIADIVKIYQLVAANKIRVACEHLENRIAKGMSIEDATNQTGIEICEAADLHCRAFILDTGYKQMNIITRGLSKELGNVFMDLLELYAVNAVFDKLGDILRFTTVNNNDLVNLQERLESLLAKIRPNAVGIVDGFDLHDAVLQSALGSFDGNVYERIFEESQKSPLNQEPVNKSFHLYLKPFMQSNL